MSAFAGEQRVLIEERQAERADVVRGFFVARVVGLRKVGDDGRALVFGDELDDLPGAGVGDEDGSRAGLNGEAAGVGEAGEDDFGFDGIVSERR